MSPFCGLIIVCSRQPVPLRGISVEVQVKGFVADVSATLKYKNTEEKPIEAVFVFPLDQDSAVYSFEATIEGKKIVADLQEREQANKTYDEAISKGQQAFLLQEDKSSGDIFSCSVGNLPPGQEAEVKLSFVQELPLESDGAVRFVLPAVLNPRYTPKDHEESITVQVPRVPIGQIPYTLDLTAHFYSAYGISKIQSNCGISPIEYTDSDKTAAKVSLAPGHKFERDVELLAYYTDVNKPSVTAEAGLPDAKTDTLMADPAVMLNFYPSFPATQEQSNCGEFLFLMDRSGSMECGMNSEPNAPQRIESAKETLVLLLKSLPLGCYFNIIGFGSHFEFFFPETIEYTQETMDEAVKKVNKMEANMGGTEILQPLKKIYKTAVRPDHPRQLFVFTDGEVGNTKQVIEEVQRNAHNHRCFAFGIGEGASTSLIKGISRAAGGTCEFITGKERMQPKVLKALKNSLQPTVKEISLKWTLPPGVESVLLSKPPSNIFQGHRAIVYAQLKGKISDGEGEVSLEYKFKDEMFRNSLKFPLKVEKAERPTIHRLGAKALISELESGTNSESEEVKKRIIESSIQSGVISSLTAFVAVNKETKTPVQGPPVRRDIPTPGLMYGAPMACMRSMPAGGFMFGGARCYAQSMPMSADMAKPGMTPLGGGLRLQAKTSNKKAMKFASAAPRFHSDDEFTFQAKEVPALFKLISLQKADGSWTLNSDLASILGLSLKNMQENDPKQSPDPAVWATLLAVIWLHARCLDQRDEWELLEHKAVSWIKSRAGSSSLRDSIKAGNDLLKSAVDPEEFGL